MKIQEVIKMQSQEIYNLFIQAENKIRSNKSEIDTINKKIKQLKQPIKKLRTQQGKFRQALRGQLKLSKDQFDLVFEGLKKGIDVSLYAKPEYTAAKMEQIKLGLINKVDVKHYLCEKFSSAQMSWIREGLQSKIDVNFYNSPDYSTAFMKTIYNILVDKKLTQEQKQAKICLKKLEIN